MYSALLEVAKEAEVSSKICKMFAGEKINSTEKRSVLHVALRMDKTESLELEGEGDVIKAIWEVRDKIEDFSNRVRNGTFKGYSGKPLTNVVVIGIGGSYLGPEFVYEALRFDSV